MSTTAALFGSEKEDARGGIIWLPFGTDRGGGFLTTAYEGHLVTVHYHPAKMDLILLLNEELGADIKDGKPFETRGWRSPEDLIPLLADPLQQPQTLRRTIWSINRTFRDIVAAAVPGLPVPRLLETKRGIGVRLPQPYQVEYLISRKKQAPMFPES